MSARIYIIILCLLAAWSAAGPYSPAAGQAGSDAVAQDTSAFVAWASGWTNYVVGAECGAEWQDPSQALGAAGTNTFDIVCLGRGGQITLVFDEPIKDGPGPDFAVFENAVTDEFLELAYCEVSSDGVNFSRFPSHSLTPEAVGPYGLVYPSDVDGLAGKYRVGYGTPFDLAVLDDPNLDLDNVRFVRVADIVGDGSFMDSHDNPIYDPYETYGSAGFDLDAVGVLSNDTHEVRIEPVADLAEWGDTVGAFRIARKSWDYSEPLEVAIEHSGTATSGVDYEELADFIVIPAGSDSVLLGVEAIPDGLVEGDESVVVSLVEGAEYIHGRSDSAALTLRDSPIAVWKLDNFGDDANDPLAQDGADWDGDGKSNLLEYALGSDPVTADSSDMSIAVLVEEGVAYVEVNCPGGEVPDDVLVRILKSEQLADGAAWTDVGEPQSSTETGLRLRLPTEEQTYGAYFKLGVERR